jgi:hypothetical protein
MTLPVKAGSVTTWLTEGAGATGMIWACIAHGISTHIGAVSFILSATLMWRDASGVTNVTNAICNGPRKIATAQSQGNARLSMKGVCIGRGRETRGGWWCVVRSAWDGTVGGGTVGAPGGE